MSFGSYLQNKRKERGYTQEQMAELLGVDKSSISRYENNKMYPEISIFKLYRTTLGLSRDEFYEALEGEYIPPIETRSDKSFLVQCNFEDLMRLATLELQKKNEFDN